MNIYKPAELSKLLRVSQQTLINWEKKELLIPCRTITNRKYYTDKHLEQLGIDPATINKEVS